MAAWNDLGPESVPDRFSGAGAYTESNNALCLKKGLAHETMCVCVCLSVCVCTCLFVCVYVIVRVFVHVIIVYVCVLVYSY